MLQELHHNVYREKKKRLEDRAKNIDKIISREKTQRGKGFVKKKLNDETETKKENLSFIYSLFTSFAQILQTIDDNARKKKKGRDQRKKMKKNKLFSFK